MKNLSEYCGQKLEFIQPSVWKTYYELKAKDEIIGTVKKFKKFGFQLEVAISGKRWIIYRPSFWRSEIAVRESGYSLPYAKYKGGIFKQHGTIELPRGERIKMVFKTFKKDYEIRDSSDELLVRFVDKIKFRTTMEMFIEKRTELIDKYPWIIVLAWYISAQRKSSAIAAAG